MRGSTILDIPLPEQEWMLAEVRHARRGCVLTLHILLLCAAGRTPTEIATFLFCSRTSVYCIVNAYQTQVRDARRRPECPILMPSGLEMIDDRNLTVHTYNEAVAEDIYSNLPRYADLLAVWLAAMEGRVEPR